LERYEEIKRDPNGGFSLKYNEKKEQKMAVAKKKPNAQEEIPVLEITQGCIDFHIVGTTPLICNSMSEKAAHELLLPKGRKTDAEKRSTLKHNPPEEYRDSIYRATESDAPTRITILATSFKSALRDAAIDMPDVNKSQIGRLTYVEGDYRNGSYVHIYGVPELHMCFVRSANMARTPDVRTRAIIPEWACILRIKYTMPLLRERSVSNLLAASGLIRGVGDWRPEKGSGSYGQFKLVPKSDSQFKRIVKNGGREDQDSALLNPSCYDGETAKLLTWFHSELSNRGFDEKGRPIGTLAKSDSNAFVDNGEDETHDEARLQG
jgi:hypothetical protein